MEKDSIPPSCIIFTGGTAFNSYISTFSKITAHVSYILPVSDDGGSTAEIIRCLGGPAIGDLRSRIIRLARNETCQDAALLQLLSYRLPHSQSKAIEEWEHILHLKHPLWTDISAFLTHFQNELLPTSPSSKAKASKTQLFIDTGLPALPTDHSTTLSEAFDFRHGSIDAAIFQLTALLGVPRNTSVIPVIADTTPKKVKQSVNFTEQIYQVYQKNQRICSTYPSFGLPELDSSLTIIAALLRNGDKIIGQCEISHPGEVVPNDADEARKFNLQGKTPVGYTAIYDAILQIFSPSRPAADLNNATLSPAESKTSLISRTVSNLFYDKNESNLKKLPASIRRIYYSTCQGHEVMPKLNPLIPQHFSSKRSIIYGVGSLYTSLLPLLVVAGMGRLISAAVDKPKILLLNGSWDRETFGYTAMDYIYAITDALNYSCYADTFALSGTEAELQAKNDSNWEEEGKMVETDGRAYQLSPFTPVDYISHLFYLEEGDVKSDIKEIEGMGIKCVQVYSDPVEKRHFDQVHLASILKEYVQ